MTKSAGQTSRRDRHIPLSGDETNHAFESGGPEVPRVFHFLQVAIIGVILGILVMIGIGLMMKGRPAGPTKEILIEAPTGSHHPTNFFELRRVSVPPDQILHSGERKDYKLSLNDPQFVPAEEATFLRPEDRVIGVEFAGESRCYPLVILEHHEVVNDHIGGAPILVTYCPLSDSMAVFDPRIKGLELNFGVSGLIYNGSSLFYNRRNGGFEALWSSVKAESLTRSRSLGGELDVIPFEVTTWADWHQRQPATTVLSTDSGDDSDYVSSSFDSDVRGDWLEYPVKPMPPEEIDLPLRSLVLGVWSGSAARAFPIEAFAEHHEAVERTMSLDGLEFMLTYNPESASLRMVDAAEELKWAYSSWFAWYAFHPETDIYSPPQR